MKIWRKNAKIVLHFLKQKKTEDIREKVASIFRAAFTGERSMRSPRCFYKTEIKSTGFVETFASPKSQEVSSYFFFIIRNKKKKRNCHNLNSLLLWPPHFNCLGVHITVNLALSQNTVLFYLLIFAHVLIHLCFQCLVFVLTKTHHQFFPLNYGLSIRELYIRFSLQEYNLRECGGFTMLYCIPVASIFVGA
jgi:hypothetical protein